MTRFICQHKFFFDFTFCKIFHKDRLNSKKLFGGREDRAPKLNFTTCFKFALFYQKLIATSEYRSIINLLSLKLFKIYSIASRKVRTIILKRGSLIPYISTTFSRLYGKLNRKSRFLINTLLAIHNKINR